MAVRPPAHGHSLMLNGPFRIGSIHIGSSCLGNDMSLCSSSCRSPGRHFVNHCHSVVDHLPCGVGYCLLQGSPWHQSLCCEPCEEYEVIKSPGRNLTNLPPYRFVQGDDSEGSVECTKLSFDPFLVGFELSASHREGAYNYLFRASS